MTDKKTSYHSRAPRVTLSCSHGGTGRSIQMMYYTSAALAMGINESRRLCLPSWCLI